MRSLTALTLFFLYVTAAAAQTKDARTLFQEANAAFAVGEFVEAAEKYQAAYKLKQDPALLYNAAQAYRLGGNNDKALVLYKNYVLFFPKERNIEEIKQQIIKLKEAIASQERVKTAPPINTEEPRTPIPNTPTRETQPTAEQPTAQTAPAEVKVSERRDTTPIYKKWWLWTIVGVVVVGAVVTGAVVATTPSGKWQTGPDFGPGAQALGVSW